MPRISAANRLEHAQLTLPDTFGFAKGARLAPSHYTREVIMPRDSFLPTGLDPLGAGAVFVSVAALVAMLVALRAPAPPPATPGSAYVTSAVDLHHPVDRHDDVTLHRFDAPSVQMDVHHPVDRHDP
jgi:hypothetical protein